MRAATLALVVALTVVLAGPAVADPAHDPVAYCDHWHRQGPVLAFAGYATLPAGHPEPLTLTVTCTFSMENGTRSLTATATSPGPAAVVTGNGWLGADTVRRCVSALARYRDGHVGSYGPVCDVPLNQ